MATLVLRDVGVWIDGLDMAGVSNSVSLELTADAPEATVFKQRTRRRVAGGLKTSAFSLEGYIDEAVIDTAIAAKLARAAGAMVVPDGMTPGDVAYIVPMVNTAYSNGASVGELLAQTFAGEGDGDAVRAQVFDVREDVTADNVTARVNLGPILAGETLDVWVHITRRAGRVQISIESAANQTTGTATTRGGAAGINTTRLEKYSIAGPVTDEWWQLRYDFSVGSPDFDFASAAAVR